MEECERCGRQVEPEKVCLVTVKLPIEKGVTSQGGKLYSHEIQIHESRVCHICYKEFDAWYDNAGFNHKKNFFR